MYDIIIRRAGSIGKIISRHQKLRSFRTTRSFSEGVAAIKLKIPQGELLGKSVTSADGLFYSFQGIPYAKPPIGALRFKAPQSPESWVGVRDATKEGNVCPHMDMFTGSFIGDEDCLFLNVFTPSLKSEKPLPVMVWLHGGAFMMGCGNDDLYGPHYFMKENVILVTLNYRLGPLGFLTLDSQDVPGNAGCKDQIAALRWVQKNINLFGGDANNVTLFGESAGAACAHYLTISPLAEGLFKRVIMQSGSAAMEWAFIKNGKERAVTLGAALGSKTEDTNKLLEHLQSASAEDIVMGGYKTITTDDKRRGLPIPYAPTIEKKFTNQEQFLTDHPVNLLKNGMFSKIPMIFGYNSNEGMIMMRNALKKIELFDSDFERMIPKHMNIELYSSLAKEVSAKIKQYYFQDQSVSKKTLPQMSDLMTDYHFATGLNLTVKLQSLVSDTPIYVYKFSFEGELNMFKNAFGLGKLAGACHGDEMFYMFKSCMMDLPIDYKSPSNITRRRMVRLWTNFAKTGNPTPTVDDVISVSWLPVSKEANNYLDIGTNLKLDTNIDGQRAKFWQQLFEDVNGDFLKPKL